MLQKEVLIYLEVLEGLFHLYAQVVPLLPLVQEQEQWLCCYTFLALLCSPWDQVAPVVQADLAHLAKSQRQVEFKIMQDQKCFFFPFENLASGLYQEFWGRTFCQHKQ